MKTWRNREELLSQATMLARQGLSRRAIARALDVSRNTVRKLIEQHHHGREVEPPTVIEQPRRVPRTTKLDAHHARILELLEGYPDITAQRIFEELEAVGYDGGYTAVKDHVRRLRPRSAPEPSKETPEYGPGAMAESDWSPYSIKFTHAPRALVQAFSYVLTYSTRKHFALYERSDLHALMDGHVAAFERFGGAAHECKYDNQKAVVLGREGGQPIYNPRFLAFSTHYDFRPVACRPRRPNDKPRVERAFWEFERSFLNGREFRDLDDMRVQLLLWQDTVADPRPRRRRSERPRMELFAEEQPLLQPLPRHPYDTARVIYRICSIEGFISWDGNLYAVPYEHITDILPVRVMQRELRVYAADLQCVACHELASRSAGVKVGAQTYHPQPGWRQRRGTIDIDQLQRTFGAMGQAAAAFFDALCAALPRLAGYHARRILLNRERYATADLCKALRHAQAYGAFEHHAVERILLAHARPRQLAEYVAEDLAHRLAPCGGKPETGPRDLTEFDRLPTVGEPSPQDKT